MRSITRNHIVLLVVLSALVLTTVFCSSGPRPPAQGSPEWHWANAVTTWDSGDLLKTSDNLESIAKADSPLAAKAMPWRLIVTAGLMSAYIDIADAFERGGRANQAAAASFRVQMNNYRTMANRQVAQFYQTFMEMKKAAPAGPIPLDFSFPKGSAMAVAELTKAGQGIAVSEAEMSGAEKRALQRGVLMAASSAVGAEGDTAKTQQIFSAENATVPKDTFMLAMAKTLHEAALFYGPYKQDQPDRLKLFNEQALEILNALPESDDNKELIKTIEQEIKAADKR